MFLIEINCIDEKSINEIKPCGEYDFECSEEFIMDICERLADENVVQFLVEGFGLNWPIDVQTDLATLIPQIPKAIHLLTNSKNFTLEFYEQGIERELRFSCHNDEIHIKCGSLLGGWDADVKEIETKNNIESLLKCFLNSFIDLAARYYPSLNLHKELTYQK